MQHISDGYRDCAVLDMAKNYKGEKYSSSFLFNILTI
jgi:hypothetical protein